MGLTAHAQERQFLTWTDTTGGYKIEASFVRLSADSVELQDKQGKAIKVPLAKLSLESQLQAKKMANPKAFEKAAPAAGSLVMPTDIGPSPFPANPTIEQFMDTFIREQKAHNQSVVWHAMPKEMQTQVDELVVKGVEIAGSSILTQVRSLLGNVGKIVREKKQFILAHPQVSSNQALNAALSSAWPEIAAVTDVLTDKSIWAASNFQKGKVGPWFCALQNKLGPPADALGKKVQTLVPPGALGAGVPSLDDFKYKVLSKTADTAQLEISVPGQPPAKVEFKRDGGSWLPAQIADQWKAQLATAQSALAGLNEEKIKQGRLMVGATLTTVGGFVGSLANAQTQEEFNQVVDQLVALAQQGSMQVAGASAPPPGNGQSPGGQPHRRPGRPGLGSDR